MAKSVKVFFSLGSNQGDRLSNINAALGFLARICRDLTASRVYETEPLYYRSQPSFLNCAATAAVAISPRRLLSFILRIEKRLGGARRRQYGPRALAIDIVLYGEGVD